MQLTLPVHLPVDQQFDSFVVGENTLLVERLKSLLTELSETTEPGSALNQVFIHAGKGMGKSHLLYALCHFAETLRTQSFYLNLNQASKMPVSLLDGLSHTALLCIDDVHSVVSNHTWQVALFDLINQRIEQQSGLIVFTSKTPPVSSFFNQPEHWLPDLVSRFSWGETYTIKPLDHQNQVGLLKQLAHQKGLNFSAQAINFVLNHCERNTDGLVNIIERLDKRSMIEKKPISVNMIKRELEL